MRTPRRFLLPNLIAFWQSHFNVRGVLDLQFQASLSIAPN